MTEFEVSDETDMIPANQASFVFSLTPNDKPIYFPGIPILTNDMARNSITDVNSRMALLKSSGVNLSSEILRNKFNAVLKINYEGIDQIENVELKIAAYNTLIDRKPIPDLFKVHTKGLFFRAQALESDVNAIVQVKNIDREIIQEEEFLIQQDSMQRFSFLFDSDDFHHFSFLFHGKTTKAIAGSLVLDDIYLQSDEEVFTPPSSDTEFLTWLKQSGLRFFIDQYRQITPDKGAVLETYLDEEKISIGGIGFAFAAFHLAVDEGMLSEIEAKERTNSMLNWMVAQNWFDGSGGWHGFPHHYLNKEGTFFWPDISTVDWAISAAGIRFIRQKYQNDPDLVAKATALLNRPQWEKSLGSDGRIVMGFDGMTGLKNEYRWGLAFSEETEMVYLEALATKKLDEHVLSKIVRLKASGFYPSWFGSGFTYNWLQLWTGPITPYSLNSELAFQADLSTALKQFGDEFMGLTASFTMKEVSETGYINWGRYISNQGSEISGASSSEVIQISPSPYGAALALPFNKIEAIRSLRAYVELGYYHPILGLPDTVRMSNLKGLDVPVPNWNQGDITLGPMVMAIEQVQKNDIANYVLKDNDIESALNIIIKNFNY